MVDNTNNNFKNLLEESFYLENSKTQQNVLDTLEKIFL